MPPNHSLAPLYQNLELCMVVDRFPIRQQIRRLKKRADHQSDDYDKQYQKITQRIERSKMRADNRRQVIPDIEYPSDLPVSARKEEIRKIIKDSQVVILAGETGSGKTTQLPKICLESGLGIFGAIAHTQPRRIAARTVAIRIAEEMKSELGQLVGYKVRFHEQVGEHCLVKLMTDGILLAEIQSDPYLNQYDTIIIDEAHERSLNIDFLLGYLRQLLIKRKDLKLIITSATIDVSRFSTHFAGAPVIEVSGRTYPVQIEYRPTAGEDGEESTADVAEAVLNTVNEITGDVRWRSIKGARDILVFLSGEREIRETAVALRKHGPSHLEVLPLYARLSQKEQSRIFHPRGGQRVVLATNVAETSLTVPNIRFVIDTGFARISRYSFRTKIQRLPIEPISQASANQRKGRCGRIADGICFRLYSEVDFNHRDEYTDPEILRTNLASVILQMESLRLGHIHEFPFIDPPDQRLINDGYGLLEELSATDSKRNLTSVGKQLARLPVDPRIGRMIIAAQQTGCLREIIIIAAALSVQDPRERPQNHSQQSGQSAEQKHASWKDKTSDFMAYVNMWNETEEQRQTLSSNQYAKFCKKNLLSYMRMREWRDVHRQLRLVCSDLPGKQKFTENTEPAGSDLVHQALLSGLVANVAMKDEEREYLGARNRKMFIFPGSALRKKSPKWIMASEIVETSRVFARTVAKIEPEWIEQAAAHLLKYHYFEPHWEKKSGNVVAFEQATLYGLIINPRKKVNYGPINTKEARELFILAALVAGEFETKGDFFKYNQQCIHEIDELENKSRRRDILADEQVLYDFYDALIPADVHNRSSFEAWRRKAERQNAKLLFISKDMLLARDTADVTEEKFPDQLILNGIQFGLKYHFEPGHEDDGVTIVVPAPLLKQIDADQLEWLVPGMLREKCIALIKGLPKKIRKNFVPVPNHVDGFLVAGYERNTPLTTALSDYLRKTSGVTISQDQWQLEEIEPHHLMQFETVDEKGEHVGKSRSLSALQSGIKQHVAATLAELPKIEFQKKNVTRWDSGDFPREYETRLGSQLIKSYPAFKVNSDLPSKERSNKKGSSKEKSNREKTVDVSIELFPTALEAQQSMEQGLIQLVYIELSESIRYLKKNIKHINEMAIAYRAQGNQQQMLDDIILAGIRRCFFDSAPFKTDTLWRQADFDENLSKNRKEFVTETQAIAELVYGILKQAQKIRGRLGKSIKPEWLHSISDIKEQMDQLIQPEFIQNTPAKWLRRFPKYLAGIEYRLEKLQDNRAKDRELTLELATRWKDYQAACQTLSLKGIDDSRLLEYRWMIEEFRLSSFAQKYKTITPVSATRLDRLKSKLMG